MSKTTRRPLTRGKSVAQGCRNNGDCDWCNGNRAHAARKAELESQQDLDDAGWGNKLSDLFPWLRGTDIGGAKLVRDDRDKDE